MLCKFHGVFEGATVDGIIITVFGHESPVKLLTKDGNKGGGGGRE